MVTPPPTSIVWCCYAMKINNNCRGHITLAATRPASRHTAATIRPTRPIGSVAAEIFLIFNAHCVPREVTSSALGGINGIINFCATRGVCRVGSNFARRRVRTWTSVEVRRCSTCTTARYYKFRSCVVTPTHTHLETASRMYRCKSRGRYDKKISPAPTELSAERAHVELRRTLDKKKKICDWNVTCLKQTFYVTWRIFRSYLQGIIYGTDTEEHSLSMCLNIFRVLLYAYLNLKTVVSVQNINLFEIKMFQLNKMNINSINIINVPILFCYTRNV